MTDEDTKIDRPITGDVQASSHTRVPQKGAAEFLAAVDDLLNTKGVKSVQWRQYTPYFNDGEPCEFSTHEVAVKLSKRFGVEEDAGDYEDGYISSYELQGESDGTSADFSGATYEERMASHAAWAKKAYSYTINGQDTRDIATALGALEASMGAFETVALTNFGDHAIVTATKDGFNVESYEHD